MLAAHLDLAGVSSQPGAGDGSSRAAAQGMGKLNGNHHWCSKSSGLSVEQAQEDEPVAETEGWKLPPVPVPTGLGHQRQGEQVCQGSLLQQGCCC